MIYKNILYNIKIKKIDFKYNIINYSKRMKKYMKLYFKKLFS